MSTNAGEVLQEVRALLSEMLQMDTSHIDETTSFTDLGADSLLIIELLTELEDRFSTYIPEQAAAQFRTVGDVLRYVQSCAVVAVP